MVLTREKKPQTQGYLFHTGVGTQTNHRTKPRPHPLSRPRDISHHDGCEKRKKKEHKKRVSVKEDTFITPNPREKFDPQGGWGNVGTLVRPWTLGLEEWKCLNTFGKHAREANTGFLRLYGTQGGKRGDWKRSKGTGVERGTLRRHVQEEDAGGGLVFEL